MKRIFRVLILLGILAGWLPPHPAVSHAPAQSDTRLLVDAGDAQALAEVRSTGAEKLADYQTFTLWQLPANAKTPSHRPSMMAVDDTLRFRGLAFQPGSAMPSLPARLRQDTPGAEGFWIVQFPGPILPEWLENLHSAGLEVVTYLPENAYLVWGKRPDEKAGKITGRGKAARWSGSYHPYYRLSPDLRTKADSAGTGAVDVTVQFYTTGRIKDSLSRLSAVANQVLQSPQQVLSLTNVRARVPVKALAEIAGWPDVINIETYRPPELMDEAQGQILAGNVTINGGVLAPSGPGYLAWLNAKGFSTDPGQYPIVDVMDDGLDAGNAASILHPDFHQLGQPALPDRVSYITNCTSDSTGNAIGGHGNLNAGILAGYNALSGLPYQDAAGYHLGLGISPYGPIAATKIFNNQGYDTSKCSGSDTTVVYTAYSNGARITSNSWGVPGSGQYDTLAQEYDAFTRDASLLPGNQEMLHIFAAGNAGRSSRTINSPASAKNILAVGASENVRDAGIPDGCGESAADNANDIAYFSSRGPAADGRAKPEIIAPGTHVQGPASQDPSYTGNTICGGYRHTPYYPANQTFYTWSSGTSHSTPAISGVAQLVYAYYQKTLKPGISPSPAMTKALMLNTPRYMAGLDAGGTLPGTGQGWGSADMGQIFDSTPRILVNQSRVFTATGQSYSISGQVSDPTRPFHVSLVWTDAPGNTTSGSAAVNNLDLEVTIGGVKYLGNVFSGANSTSGGLADSLNNVENVFLPAGTQGAFQIRVIAHNISGDGIPGTGSFTDQDFALVVYNASEIPMPFIAVHDTSWTQFTGNGNGAIDPGETIDLHITLENQGSAVASGIRASLVTDNPLVEILTGTVDYPDLPAGDIQAGLQNFRLRIGLAFPCQVYVPLSLKVTYGSATEIFPIQTLTLGTTIQHHYTSSAPPVAIPDFFDLTPGKATVPLWIPDSYPISDLNVGVDITHTFIGDLTLQVVSPEGVVRTLSENNGGSGTSYHNTIFDDQIGSPVTSGMSPFTGYYQPEQALDVYNTRPAYGQWNLIALDNYAVDTGTVLGFTIDVLERQCSAYPIAISGGNAFRRAAAGETVQFTLGITNAGDIADTFDVEVTDLWGSSLPSTVGPIKQGQTANLNLAITVPPGTPPGIQDHALVVFRSQSDPTEVFEVRVTVVSIMYKYIPFLRKIEP